MNFRQWLTLVCFSLIVWGTGVQSNLFAQPENKGQVIDKIITKVNDQIVLKSELEVARYQAASNGMPMEGADCQILQSLIVNKMLLVQADLDSVVVDDNMIESQLDRRMQYFVAQFGGEAELEKAYGKRLDELKEEFRPQLKDQLTIQRMQEKIMNKVSVTPAYVRQFFKKIPADSLPYFPTEVELGHIVKFPEVSREQKEKTINFLNEIKQRVKDGEDFCTMASLYSQDEGSAGLCGEIVAEKGQLVPEYEAACRELAPGEISAPVESQYGFHLIQLIERTGSRYKSRHILIKPEASREDLLRSKDFLEDIKVKIDMDSIEFEQAAIKYSDDVMSKSQGGIFTDPNTASSKLTLDQLESDVYFIIDTMKIGNVSPPIEYTTQDGRKAYRLIYFKSKTPPHIANLSDDYIRISEAALNNKKSEALESWFEKAKTRMYIDVDEEYKPCNVLN